MRGASRFPLNDPLQYEPQNTPADPGVVARTHGRLLEAPRPSPEAQQRAVLWGAVALCGYLYGLAQRKLRCSCSSYRLPLSLHDARARETGFANRRVHCILSDRLGRISLKKNKFTTQRGRNRGDVQP